MSLDLDRLVNETLTEKARTNFMSYDGVFLPEYYKLYSKVMEDFEVNNDDVFVCSFQKSGTTWAQEMVWGITHDLDFESAKVSLVERFPYLEFSGIVPSVRIAHKESVTHMPRFKDNSFEYCKQLSSPRYIKSHLPFNVLPRQLRTGEKKPKIVYIARNPKDTCISYYHHSKIFEGYVGTFEQFCELFLGDKVVYGPYWKHIISFSEKKNQENILFITFEDMKADLPSVIRKTAAFLGKTLNDQQVAALADHLSFNKMKENPSVNHKKSVEALTKSKILGDFKPQGEFLRNGNVGQWKDAMSEEMIKRFDKWTEDNLKNHKDLKLWF